MFSSYPFLLVLLFIAVPIHAVSGKEHFVRTAKAFAEAAGGLAAGDTVTIANGSYSGWSVVVTAHGTAENPVIVRAETVGGVLFNGPVTSPVFLVTGSHVQVQGFVFKDCVVGRGANQMGVLIDLSGSASCRITECNFIGNRAASQSTPLVVISGKALRNRVDRCLFSANIDSQDLQVRITQGAVPEESLIEDNVFQDKPPVSWANGNGGECVQIGQDPVHFGNEVSKTVVRHNRFIRCKGEPEIISNKSSRNTYDDNYIEGCMGELVMRGGHDCIITGNKFINGGSIRINGTGHTIRGNTIVGAETGIRLMYGMARGKAEMGFYIAASDCVVKDNQLENCGVGILVGGDKGRDWTGKFNVKRYPSGTLQNVAPFNNSISDNRFISTKTEMVVAE